MDCFSEEDAKDSFGWQYVENQRSSEAFWLSKRIQALFEGSES